MANAGCSIKFEMKLNLIDEGMKKALTAVDFEGVHLWSSLFEYAPGTAEHAAECQEMAEGLGATGAQAATWAKQAADLHLCALGFAGAAAHRVAKVDGLALSADHHHYQKVTERQQVKRDLRVMEAYSLSSLPTEWRGKRYKRTEGATEQARATAEHKERARRGKELAALLLEAGLPFAHSPGVAAAEEGALLRCCRGLSAKTLQQRLAC